MARVLLIDDDPSLRDVLAMALEDAGHAVVCAADGREGLRRFQTGTHEVVVSDVNMPELDGFSLCRRIRESGSQVPLVLLTSRDSEIDEALGLELGADDYVTKPFSTRVLLARISALLRREAHRRAPAPTEVRTLGPLSVDAERMEVCWRDTALVLTVTEFRLVDTLSNRPGVVFSRSQLLDRIRGDDSIVAERLVDTYVRRLRRKFEATDSSFAEIETMVGAGYRWRG